MKILLIDDETAFIQGMQLLLNEEGFDTDCTTDASEGLKWIKERSYNVIVTDILMPDKDGIEVITELLKDKNRPKIIAISGGGRIDASDYLETAAKFGVEGTLSKPFTKDKLVELIRKIQ